MLEIMLERLKNLLTRLRSKGVEVTEALPAPVITYNEICNVNTVTIRISLDNGLFVNKVFESRWDADGHLEESALEQYEGFKRDLAFNSGKGFFKLENVSHYAGVTKIEEFYAVSTVTVTRKAA